MTLGAFINLACLLILLGVSLKWLGSALLTRVSPKYAARREIQRKARMDRLFEGRRRRDEADKDRQLAWAQAHPDDPVAKIVLEQHAAGAFRNVFSATDSVESIDPAEELRRRQHEHDEFERRQALRKTNEEELTKRLLTWALENPEVPEARRHLEEQLLEVDRKIKNAQSDITLEQLRIDRLKLDDAEAIAATTVLDEARTRKADAEQLLGQIQAALTRASATSA